MISFGSCPCPHVSFPALHFLSSCTFSSLWWRYFDNLAWQPNHWMGVINPKGVGNAPSPGELTCSVKFVNFAHFPVFPSILLSVPGFLLYWLMSLYWRLFTFINCQGTRIQVNLIENYNNMEVSPQCASKLFYKICNYKQTETWKAFKFGTILQQIEKHIFKLGIYSLYKTFRVSLKLYKIAGTCLVQALSSRLEANDNKASSPVEVLFLVLPTPLLACLSSADKLIRQRRGWKSDRFPLALCLVLSKLAGCLLNRGRLTTSPLFHVRASHVGGRPSWD